MLRGYLQAMLDDASRKHNVVMRKVFTKGLHLALVVTDKSVQLSISRDKVYPSDKEWKTVLEHFPYFVGRVEPIKFVDGQKRFAMRAKLPRREDVAQQLAFSGQHSAVSQPEDTESDEKIQE